MHFSRRSSAPPLRRPTFFLPPKPRKWHSPENVHGPELISLQFTKGFVNMFPLIPAFRSLLSSGASLLSGAFFFGTRKVSWFLGLAALVLSASLPASANAASQHTITFDHYSLMIDGKRVSLDCHRESAGIERNSTSSYRSARTYHSAYSSTTIRAGTIGH